MKTIKSYQYYLRVLKSCDKKCRQALLKAAPQELILVLAEICLNLLSGNIKITKQVKNALKQHKTAIRQVASYATNIRAKRKILVQRGGFLIPLLTGLFSGLIGKLLNNATTTTRG